MCGIAGIITEKKENDLAMLVREMVAAIAYRGPDDRGEVTAGGGRGRWAVGLGHCRLAIIDLQAGRQPMMNDSGSVQLVYNGEVYNFKELREELKARGCAFRTASDTEVVLRAWEAFGESCVDRFRGMFALAVWDADRDSLFLARDRFGQKPLYYYEGEGNFIFASEIKALLKCPYVKNSLNTEALASYLISRYVPAPETLFTGIKKLLPGTAGLWKNGKLTVSRYYTPPDREPGEKKAKIVHPVREFLRLFEKTVALHMISDVPFGAFLSGGLDSSALVAAMSKHSPHSVKTFSIGFHEAGYDETEYARLVSRLFGAEHRELIVTSLDIMNLIPELIRFRDAPLSEPTEIPLYLLSRFASREVKMVLSGEGGDELLAGYPKHVAERLAGLCRLLPAALRRGLLEPLARALPYGWARVKTALLALMTDDFTTRMLRWFGTITAQELKKVTAEKIPFATCAAAFPFLTPAANSPLRKILFFDQTSWLPDNLLERGDRLTMAASLEARMPFLDHVLAAFVSSLPDRFRVRGTQTKWILRKAMEGILPARILQRPKVGFKVPVGRWFRSAMREYVYDHLTGAEGRVKSYFRVGTLERLLAAHVTGKENNEKMIWTLLNLELWHRAYA